MTGHDASSKWRESLRVPEQSIGMSKSETIAKDVLDRFQSVQKSVERRWKRLQISAPDLQDIATPVLFP